ncbi:MAG: hypothetical protein R3E79_17795 [Caldilineaceae bacterium]
MNQSKKCWTAPRVTVYGDIEKITQQNNQTNSDTPQGTPDSAFPVLT